MVAQLVVSGGVHSWPGTALGILFGFLTSGFAAAARDLRALGEAVDQTRNVAVVGAALAAVAIVLAGLAIRSRGRA